MIYQSSDSVDLFVEKCLRSAARTTFIYLATHAELTRKQRISIFLADLRRELQGANENWKVWFGRFLDPAIWKDTCQIKEKAHVLDYVNSKICANGEIWCYTKEKLIYLVRYLYSTHGMTEDLTLPSRYGLIQLDAILSDMAKIVDTQKIINQEADGIVDGLSELINSLL